MMASNEMDFSGVLLDVAELPRPPGAQPAPRPARRKPALDVLADWLCAYGSHQDIEHLPQDLVAGYLAPDDAPRSFSARASRMPVFAGLMTGAFDDDTEIV